MSDPGSSAVPDRAPPTGDPSTRAGLSELARVVEALLFLSPDPVAVGDLAEACEADADEVVAALAELGEALQGRGLFLREVASGWTLATDPDAEEAARRQPGTRAPALG